MKILPTGTYEKKVCFDSGREVLASEGLISIDEHGDLWDGSDGDFRAYDPPLTPAERRDLADFMIERWQRWAGLTEDELDDDSTRWAVHRFARHWQCPCGAKLTVRSATERDDGPSNFRLQSDPTQPSFGHATLPSDQLNWAGLAEERGWLRGADGRLRCTACAQGVPFSWDATDAASRRYRGVPLSALSKDELIILADGLFRRLESERARHRADLDALI